jgi:hypothetical protein
MSSLIIKGDTSGAITLSAPNAAGDSTYTLPAVNGSVMVSGNMPAFSASITTITSISNNTFTKITYDNEIFDTNNNYTNSIFTPTVAGYYYMVASLSGLSSFGTNAPIAIFKNGGWDSVGVNVNGYANVAALFYANGTTDYFEVYQYQNSGTTQSTSAQSQARFSGVLVRAA